MTLRLWQEPAQGDLLIAIPVADPMAAYASMQAADPDAVYGKPIEVPKENGIRFIWRDGQHLLLTRNRTPFAVVHYRTSDWPRMRAFFEDILDVDVHALPVVAQIRRV